MQFIDLAAQYRALGTDIRANIDKVLEHGKFIMGPEVGELEGELARFAGVAHAVGCSSGTDALLLPLMAWGIGPGDAVFTTPFTFIATAEVVSLLGATPVFVDIDERTFNIDPDKLREKVVETAAGGELKPKAVIAVDLFGQLADYDAIGDIAREHGLKVIEDAAQSFGAAHGNRRAGSFGDVAATSFFPAKPLGCFGDGGAVLTDDAELAATMDSLRVHGKGGDKYDNVRIGVNARLDTLQAAILLPKLKALPGELEARQRVADRYEAGLTDVVETPYVADGYRSAWAQYTVMSDDRDGLQARLKARGVPTAVYYPKPLHLQTAFAPLGHRTGDFPVSESASSRVVSLPMHPYMDDATQDEIIAAVRGN
ncbi:MAG: DegT/DnrJ/EryC1/StrS family aminotransferase [Planctomycetes bacterium]|nr:DegT/DnrJ/EryC1/StrS family aminotransferase [Planctomycetota bacterium]